MSVMSGALRNNVHSPLLFRGTRAGNAARPHELGQEAFRRDGIVFRACSLPATLIGGTEQKSGARGTAPRSRDLPRAGASHVSAHQPEGAGSDISAPPRGRARTGPRPQY